MPATESHRVTFLSPGTLFSEQTTQEIQAWDPAVACEVSTRVVERYGAKPYAFFFTTVLAAPDVPDGRGGWLKVEPREVARSAMYHLGGEVLTVEDAERRYPTEPILHSNMRYNWPIVVETRRSYRHHAPFDERDVVVDASGKIVERGDTPERIRYRAKVLAAAGKE